MKHSMVGDSFETKTEHFYLIWWFLAFCIINKGFCPTCEFVFCNKLDKIRRIGIILRTHGKE